MGTAALAILIFLKLQTFSRVRRMIAASIHASHHQRRHTRSTSASPMPSKSGHPRWRKLCTFMASVLALRERDVDTRAGRHTVACGHVQVCQSRHDHHPSAFTGALARVHGPGRGWSFLPATPCQCGAYCGPAGRRDSGDEEAPVLR